MMDVEQYKPTDAVSCEAFKRDALRLCGLTCHPMADELYELAWHNGHEGGFKEVFFHLYDLAQMHLEA